jgi:hypothetical protein
MKWVTWEQVGVDRMGCAWLIRRFVDAEAEFLFVPVGQLSPPDGAEPFDIPGVRLSHHQGHCSFYALLQTYHLADPILDRIARMIDEVDTVQEVMLEPAAPGLDLLCRGLRRISPDDPTALERGALLYEALYAQLASEATPTTTARLPGAHALPDQDAVARWEEEGGSHPSDEPTAPSASN